MAGLTEGARNLNLVNGIISKFKLKVKYMEAEQINAVSNHLQDLGNRAGELRRFL